MAKNVPMPRSRPPRTGETSQDRAALDVHAYDPGVPSVELVDALSSASGATVVVAAFQGLDGPQLAPGAEPVDAAMGGRLLDALRVVGATGAADEVVKIPTLGHADFELVVVTGLGKRSSEVGESLIPQPAPLGGEQVRRAVGAALRALPAHERIRLAIGGVDAIGAVAEGALLGGYRYTAYKTSTSPRPAASVEIAATSADSSAATAAAIARAEIVSDAVLLVRDLVNTPPNDLYPQSFAERARDAGVAAGLQVEILDERALADEGYGGIAAVGAGSVRPPRLVRLVYRPTDARARIALVGKGITFDSGGLNLKRQGLTSMKSDMGGAAAVIATIIAVARLALPVEVVATVPMAENLPSGSSYRPSDVLKLRNGTTVEIDDTDAEGRVVLADAIARAIEDEPDCLLEVSTLTGAQLVALGARVMGAMGEARLRDWVVEVAGQVGESAWAMPLPPELHRGLDSELADLSNLPGDRWGSMLVGGLFIADFVPDGLPWVHLDIAGPAYNTSSAYGYTPKGATGAAVRTLIAACEQFGKNR